MRARIKRMRQLLVDKLKAAGIARNFDFIVQQRGMFSYSGLSAPQMQRLRSEFGVYGVDSGRICVAALNAHNIDHVVGAIAKVLCVRRHAGRKRTAKIAVLNTLAGAIDVRLVRTGRTR